MYCLDYWVFILRGIIWIIRFYLSRYQSDYLAYIFRDVVQCVSCLSWYCLDQYAFVPLSYNHQVGFEKEKAAQFDAGVAIDDINFIDCEMPRPSKEQCSGEKPFHCMNNVSIYIYLS